MADGSLIFDTKIDTDGFEKGTNSLDGLMRSLSKSIDDLSFNIKNAFTGFDGAQAMQATSTAIDGATDSATALEQALNSTDITISRWDDSANIEVIDAGEIEKVENLNTTLEEVKVTTQEVGATIDTSMDSEKPSMMANTFNLIKSSIINLPSMLGILRTGFVSLGAVATSAFSNLGTSTEENRSSVQSLSDAVDHYKYTLMQLESEGKYFQDTDYDNAYAGLKNAEQALNDYKKSLIKIDEEQKQVSKSSKKMNASLKGTKKAAIPLTASIFKLSNMFKLMLIRMAMKAVISSVREGFQNLAQYSNQTNRDISGLMTSMQTLKNSFATAFAPILTVVTPILRTLIGYLSQAISTAGQFFAVFLTGASTFTKAKDAQVDYAKSLKKTSKEANKALSPIDNLNTVGDSGGGGAGQDGPSPSQMFEEIEIDSKVITFMEKLKNLMQPVIDAFDRLKIAVAPFAKNVGQGLKWLWDNVLVPFGTWTISDLIPAFLDLIGAAITVLNEVIEAFKPYGLWLWDNFLKPIAEWTGGFIITVLEGITDQLYKLADWIKNNQEAFAKGTLLVLSFFAAFKIVGLVTAIAPLIGAFTSLITSGGLLSMVLGGLSGIIAAITSPIAIAVAVLGLLIYSFIDLYASSQDFRDSIAELGATWKEALEPLADFVATVLSDAWNVILKPIIDFFIKTLIPNLIDIFKDLWQKILVPFGKFIGTVLQPVFKILSDILMSLWKNIVLPLAKAVGGVLKEAWKAIYDILKITVIPIIKKVIEILQFLWDKVINPIIKVLWDNLKPAFDTVFKGIGKVITGLGTSLKGLINFIAGVFTGDWKRAWQGVKDIFKGIFDSLVAVVKTPINLIIDIINGMVGGIVAGVNAVIKAINSINFTLPDWVPGIGGKGIGFNLKTMTAPKIPKLATGTVVPANYGEFMAILGDNTREAEVVSPLSTMKQAMAEVLAELGGAGGGDINLNIFLDGKQIHSEVVKQDKAYKKKTGESAFA